MTPEQLIEELVKSDRFTIQRLIQIFDGRNIQTGTLHGTQIGTSALQKIGFYGATPIVRPATPSASASAIIAALQSLGLFT